jgi:lysyl-tRNA synthetase class 2
MATIDELRKIRLEKLKKLEDSGVLAYPAKTKRTHSIAQVLENWKKLSGGILGKKEIVIAGRIMAKRGQGGLTFLDVNDGSASLTTGGSGKIQALLKTEKLGEKGYQFFLDVFDIGDFVEVKGTLFTTKRGEKTIEATDYKMLSKALLPLPEKWHGLQDEEEKLRKRYLDIIFNPEVKERIEKRAMFWSSTREFLVNSNSGNICRRSRCKTLCHASQRARY